MDEVKGVGWVTRCNAEKLACFAHCNIKYSNACDVIIHVVNIIAKVPSEWLRINLLSKLYNREKRNLH